MPGLQLVIEIDDKGALSKVITLDGAFGKFTGGMGAKAATAASAMQKIHDSTRMLQDGFKKMALAATAFFGIDAIIGIARKGIVGMSKDLFNLVKQGAEINDLKDTFERVREKAGMLPGTLQEIRNATRNTVDDMKLMGVSARALADALDPSLLIDFWAKARQISEANGTPVSQVFEMLYLAVAKGQTRMLTGIGITLDADMAMESYALTIGKTTAQLSFQERQIAITMALEEKFNRQFKSLGELGKDAAEKFAQVGTGVRNLKDKFLSMLASSPSVEKFLSMLIDKIGALSTDMDTWEPKIKAVVDGLQKFYTGFINFASEKAGPALKNIWEFRDAIVAIAAVIGTGVVASKIMGIAVALGWVTGGTAAIVAGIAATLAGVTVGLVQSENQMQKTGAAFRGMHGGGMGTYEVFRNTKTAAGELNKDLSGLEGTLDSVLAKMTAPGLVGLKVPAGRATPVAEAAIEMPQIFDWDKIAAESEAAFQASAEGALAIFTTLNNNLMAGYLGVIASHKASDEEWYNAKVGLAHAAEAAAVAAAGDNAAAIMEARIACDTAVKDAELAHNEAVWQAWQKNNQLMMMGAEALSSGYDTLWDTIINQENYTSGQLSQKNDAINRRYDMEEERIRRAGDIGIQSAARTAAEQTRLDQLRKDREYELQMAAVDNDITWKTRREAIWASMKESFLKSTADMLKKALIMEIKNALLGEAAKKPITMRERFDAAKVGAVKAYSAFAGIPIVGPILGALAAAAAFTFLMAFHKGGFIAGNGSREQIIRVVPDEFIMQPQAVRSIGRENMEYMNATGRIPTQSRGFIASGRVSPSGGGSIGPFIFNISGADKETADNLTAFIEEKIVPMLESAVTRRKFSLEGAM